MDYKYDGARYYDSELSVWLSVDLLSDKFPGISPYAYCYHNPLNYIDPWGLEGIEDPNELTPKSVLTVKSFFKQLITPYRHVDTYEIRTYSYDKRVVKFNGGAANIFLELLQWGLENRK
ncbi:MAG: hypothetical protein KAG64_00200 [Bacteroidales bacterium]|nr:hypothetical protein [Bacteroidales bacterium]